MYETQEDFQQFQSLLDWSIGQAGTFLRVSFQMPEHSLSAHQLVHFWQGLQTVAFATVTSKGEPRVAPIGALLWRGRFYIPTVESAIRTRHVTRQPAVSFTYYQGNEIAIIIHGNAMIMRPEQTDFVEVEKLQRELSGQSIRDWGEGVFLQITPKTVYTYARQIDNHPTS